MDSSSQIINWQLVASSRYNLDKTLLSKASSALWSSTQLSAKNQLDQSSSHCSESAIQTTWKSQEGCDPTQLCHTQHSCTPRTTRSYSQHHQEPIWFHWTQLWQRHLCKIQTRDGLKITRTLIIAKSACSHSRDDRDVVVINQAWLVVRLVTTYTVPNQSIRTKISPRLVDRHKLKLVSTQESSSVLFRGR